MKPEKPVYRGQQYNFGCLVAKVLIITATEGLLVGNGYRKRFPLQPLGKHCSHSNGKDVFMTTEKSTVRLGVLWQGPAAYTKDRPDLSSERAPHKNKTVNWHTSNKYLIMGPRWGSTPRLTD
jgi:hypothetical protein